MPPKKGTSKEEDSFSLMRHLHVGRPEYLATEWWTLLGRWVLLKNEMGIMEIRREKMETTIIVLVRVWGLGWFRVPIEDIQSQKIGSKNLRSMSAACWQSWVRWPWAQVV